MLQKSWESMFLPKDSGGVSFKDFIVMNKALLEFLKVYIFLIMLLLMLRKYTKHYGVGLLLLMVEIF